MGDSKRTPKFLAVVSLGLISLGMLTWYVWPRKIELSDDTYDIAVALYRVCNQRDETGLEKVQDKLDELSETADSDDPAIARMQSIIVQAESGDWKAAMRFTRNAMEEQTREL